ncbi:hypothetical protein U1Q18_015852 [Sarracenia purpurea var. burkii]
MGAKEVASVGVEVLVRACGDGEGLERRCSETATGWSFRIRGDDGSRGDNGGMRGVWKSDNLGDFNGGDGVTCWDGSRVIVKRR